MNLLALFDGQKRDRHLARLRKAVIGSFRSPCDSKPVFIFGTQRSGTSMLMYAFHRYSEAQVWDEHRDSRVFHDFRVRDFTVLKNVLAESRFRTVCFKPICDSHLIAEFCTEFPNAHHVWIYRRYEDVANSTLAKFRSPTRAIRLVCTNQPGGGWFAEGLSKETFGILRDIYDERLTEFELACLVWWARNRVVVEAAPLPEHDFTLVRYESLVCEPDAMFRWLFDRIGLQYEEKVAGRVSSRSIGRRPRMPMSEPVQALCDSLLCELDNRFVASAPPSAALS